MAQVGTNTTVNHSGDAQPLLPAGELGVMVCLLGVPLIWTALIAGMLSGCVEMFRIMVVLAITGGLAACIARLVWLCRQDQG